MATSAAISSIANLFSFFNPSKPPPTPSIPPPPSKQQLSLSSSSNSSSSSKWTPRIASNEPQQLISSDVMSVVCPSLTYANTLFFRSAYNVQVIVDDNEPEEKLLGRFRREVMRAGVIQECKRRRFFENKQDKEKRKTREAAKRNRRRRTPFRSGPPDRQEASKDKKGVDDEDNWDLPEGVLPY